MLFLKEGKRNSKTCDSERYQFNQLNFFKMLQNNLNLEYVENNILVQKTHLTAKYEFCEKKKKKKKKRNFYFQIMKIFFGSGLCQSYSQFHNCNYLSQIWQRAFARFLILPGELHLEGGGVPNRTAII